VARRIKIKTEFRSLLSDKLMDLGNLVAATLVFGQFLTGKEFSVVVFIAGIILMTACYIGSYILSL
jgi:hypothetical protein